MTWLEQAYVKASNTELADGFGDRISIIADGNTLAVGTNKEDSAATGINGDQTDNSAPSSGAVYVLTRRSGVWQQQAYLKATDTSERSYYARGLSLSADGKSLAVTGRNAAYLY